MKPCIDPSLPTTFDDIEVCIGDENGDDRTIIVDVVFFPQATGLYDELRILLNALDCVSDDEEQLIREAIKDGRLIPPYEK